MKKTDIILPEDFDPETRALTAKNHFLAGYNCCQSVLLAYCDIIGLDPETAAVITSGFGGGMARMREVCGTVSGMAMVAGFISPAADPSVKEERTANYALVQELAGEFRSQNGSIVCKELLGLVPMSRVGSDGAGKPCAATPQESPEPSDRTPEYYRKRPCADLVACAARIVGRKLAELR